MSLAPVTSASEADALVAAIERAGVTGITAKQLSEVTQLPPARVSDRLEELSTDETITRIGRGLWILRRFAVIGKFESGFRGPAFYEYSFERQFGLRIGVKERELQFNPNERRPVHRWWPYVQGFSAAFVTETFRRFGIGRDSVVLDPFCGSGTVPITARILGAKGIGIEMMPIAAFVASAKGEWGVDPGELTTFARKVAKLRAAPTIPKPFLKETGRQFEPDILRSLLRLKENLWSLPEGPTKTLLKIAFASILIDSSNLKRAPCLGYTKKLGLTGDTPFTLFLERVQRIAEDLRTLQQRRKSWGPEIDIRVGSSAQIRLPDNSVDLAVTSPPYVNGMDYVMNYKIDLAWMGYIDSYDRLADLRASMVACDNIPRSTVVGHRPSKLVRSDSWLDSVVSTIDRNIRTKGSYRRDDMGSIVAKYFDDLVPVIENVYEALKPGARFVVVNGDSLIAGTYVPGDMIFARLASKIGFIVESFEVARTRRSGQRRDFMLRESIATLRKPGPYVPPRAVRTSQTLEDFAPPN